jgi:hypothetical protein
MPFISTMMAGLKFGLFFKQERPLICLVLEIGSIGLCFIVMIVGGIESRATATVAVVTATAAKKTTIS